MKTLLALAALAIGFTTVSHAATASNGAPTFTRVAHTGFSLLMPGNPRYEPATGLDHIGNAYTYSSGGVAYRVQVVDFFTIPNDDTTIMNSVLKSMKASRVLQNEVMAFHGLTGRFAHFETADGSTVFYWLAVRGKRFYQMVAVSERGSSLTGDAKVMFESFRPE